MLIRKLENTDRDAIREALVACGAFSDEEVQVALDIFDSPDYPHFGAECDGRIRGYVCLDKTPLTQSTWHIYWLCVHPDWQRRGIGKALESFGAEYARSLGCERLVVETSGRPDYQGARDFYFRSGYHEAGRIADYYKPGDDCVYFCRLIS